MDLDLSSSDVTWNRPPNDPSPLLVSEDSEEEDGDDKQDEEDERLQCLRFFLRALYLLGEGEDFSVNEMKKYFYGNGYSLSACFCLIFLLSCAW